MSLEIANSMVELMHSDCFETFEADPEKYGGKAKSAEEQKGIKNQE